MSKPKEIRVLHYRYRWLRLTETWIHNLITHLPARIKSHVVADHGENLDVFSVPNFYLRSRESLMSYCFRGLRYGRIKPREGHFAMAAEQSGAEIVHSHFGTDGWSVASLVSALRRRHVVTFYGMDGSYYPRQDPRWRVRYGTLFRLVDMVLCEGPVFASTLEALGCPREKLRVHHLGVEVDKIAFEPRQLSPGEDLRILLVGSFREKKGLPYAIDAIARVRRRRPVKVTIIGDAGPDAASQREKAAILSAVERSGLGDDVRMLGYQPHRVLLEEAQRHHIFMSPSVTAADGDTEGGAPVTIIEMAASGMPVVSSRHCDIPGIIQHGKTGLLAEERNVEQLATHLEWLIDHPGAWAELVTNARALIEAEFNCVVQGQRMAEIYDECLMGND